MGVNSNNFKIQSAFGKAVRNANNALQKGMEHLLEWGMQECLRCHDERHRNHIDMGDGYGWALYHNGEEVSRHIYGAWGEHVLSANEALDDFKPSKSGWFGVVLASMKPRTYFVQRVEIGFMQTAISNLKGLNFDEIFVRA